MRPVCYIVTKTYANKTGPYVRDQLPFAIEHMNSSNFLLLTYLL